MPGRSTAAIVPCRVRLGAGLPGVMLMGGLLTASAALPDIATVPADVKLPALSSGAPAAGLRVRETLPCSRDTAAKPASPCNLC